MENTDNILITKLIGANATSRKNRTLYGQGVVRPSSRTDVTESHVRGRTVIYR